MSKDKEEYKEIVVVGAGASGMLCAGILSGQGLSVALLEKNSRVGKKLSAAGNGRCNFTNIHMDADHYYGDRAWIKNVIDRITPEAVIQLFYQCGVYAREKDGYVYPHTNQASTVVCALEDLCRRQHVSIRTDSPVRDIEKMTDGGYLVTIPSGKIRCTYLVIATGGKAGKESGGDGSGYMLVRSLGHSVTDIEPGLTGLRCRGDIWSRVAGTRVQGKFTLFVDGERQAAETGEIQIVRDGVSGIPVFQLCRIAAGALREGREVTGKIDFVPSMNQMETAAWIHQHGLAGLLPEKWIPLAESSKDPLNFVKGYEFVIEDTFGIDRAQVTAGGVPVSQIHVETMESKLLRNLYLLGEIIDIDGKCGGYNLHFAWSSAMIAANEIIERDR